MSISTSVGPMSRRSVVVALSGSPAPAVDRALTVIIIGHLCGKMPHSDVDTNARSDLRQRNPRRDGRTVNDQSVAAVLEVDPAHDDATPRARTRPRRPRPLTARTTGSKLIRTYGM